MKFIHCADIHLDSKIEANLPSNKSRERKREVLRTFLKICEYAELNGVTAVIIAGDLFDTNNMSPITRDAVLGEIEKHSSVDFLYLCGNHDAGKTLTQYQLPENFKLFGEDWQSYRYDNVVITGVELNDNNCRNIYGSLRLNADDINIVTMHGQTASTSGEDMVDLSRLVSQNIDYLALGHIHSYREGILDDRGRWCYSGCPEGRGFDECGDKGFVLLETDGRFVTSEFIKFNTRTIIEVECDITDFSDFTEILEKIKNDTKTIDESAMVKVILCGNVPADAKKDLEYFSKELNDRLYFAKIKDIVEQNAKKAGKLPLFNTPFECFFIFSKKIQS